jgi:hypothetical protein
MINFQFKLHAYQKWQLENQPWLTVSKPDSPGFKIIDSTDIYLYNSSVIIWSLFCFVIPE